MLRTGSPLGLHRVLEPVGVLPQAAWRLDPDPVIRSNEARIDVTRLNLDAASFRSLREHANSDADEIRATVLDIIDTRGKMHNPITGSGGMLLGTMEEIGPDNPLGLQVGQQVATLVSLTLTPLLVTDGLRAWSGASEQIPCTGSAIVFARSIVAPVPADLPAELALAVFDVCGAPALTDRVVRTMPGATVLVLGAAGKSGSLSLAAARRAGAALVVGLVRDTVEADRLAATALADLVVVADATDPVAVRAAIYDALGRGADLTVVCVDVPGAEHGAILATADGGSIIFFSMATSFPAAALGAEGLAADVTMLVGNGYTPGHAEFALGLVRETPGVADLFRSRAGEH